MYRDEQENRPVASFASKGFDTHSVFSKDASEMESDPNSVSIIRELLNSDNEWNNVQEIVKLTLTAFYRVVSSQSAAIREIENVLPMKANKVDIHSMMNTKANVKDIRKTISDMAQDIQEKTTFEEVRKIVDSKLEPLASARGKYNYSYPLGQRSQPSDYNPQYENIRGQMTEIYEEISQKVAECQQSMAEVRNECENKPSIEDLNEILNTKANKPTVAQALHKKANKKDVEEMLDMKVNITDFKNLISTLNEKADIAELHSLKNQMDTKTDRNELHEILQSRASPSNESPDKSVYNTISKDREMYNARIENMELQLKSSISKFDNELKDIIDSFNEGLAKKADYRDLDGIGSSILNKADLDTVTDMVSEAKDQIFDKLRKTKDDLVHQRKNLSEEMYERYNKLSQKIDKCVKDTRSIKDNTKEINSEASKIRSDVKDIIFKEADAIASQVRNEIGKALDEWRTDRVKIENELAQKVRKCDFIEFKNETNANLDQKVELSEVQKALDALQTEIANRLVNTKIELQNTITSSQEHLNHQVAKKCNADEVHEIMNSKVDMHQLHTIIENKANRSDFEALRDTIDRVIREIDNKASTKELHNHIDFTRSSIEDMTKEILQKAKARDLISLSEEKANRDEVERLSQTFNKELQEKVSTSEIKASLDEQALINEALCSENCLGRWVWKSGDLKASCLVPWEVQCVNTCPDNFVWEKNKTSIICVAPGLYEIGWGIYSKHNPNIQIQVNGEGILTLFKDSDTIEKHTSMKVKDIGSHPAGNVVGLTHQDYISLPARARISFVFDGTHKAEGFVSLKKL